MEQNSLNLHGYKKIAIMGGTFDPIHYGHLVAAEAVRAELGIEKVVFMPTGNPPHKQGYGITDAIQRYIMTVLATADNPYFAVSRIETDRQGMSYTIDTVKSLKKLCDKDCQICFITGADAVGELLTWHKPEELLKMCHFIAVTRPGCKTKHLKETVDDLIANHGAHIDFLEVPALAISSTDIRNRIFAEKTVKYLLPASVEGYIQKEGLYLSGPKLKGITELKGKLHYMLSPKRFAHTRGVAEEAYKLADLYDIDQNTAYLAGLLHDCAKDLSTEETLEKCKQYGVELDKVLKAQPDLIHSFLGAAIAEHEYGITDEDILNAIRYHTTGRENMSTLEKIIYLADFFEPNRRPFDGIDTIRALAYSDLNKAMDFALNHTIDYNNKKNRMIHPLSLAAAVYYAQ